MESGMWQTICKIDFVDSSQTNSDNIVMCATQLSIVDWVYSKTQTLLVTLKTRSQPQGSLVYLRKSNICSASWMCKKQTSVSHISTESEIISLDAGLRMDGLSALDLWDVVIKVLRSSKSTESPTHRAAGNCSRNHKAKPKQKGIRDVDQLSHVDYVTTNANSAQCESQL